MIHLIKLNESEGRNSKEEFLREILSTAKVLKAVWILYVTYDIIRKWLYLLIYVEPKFLRREYAPDRFKQKDSFNLALDLYCAADNIWASVILQLHW